MARVLSLLACQITDVLAACFVDPVWSSGDVVVQKAIKYGSAYNNATRKQQTLLLDAYFPPASDTRSKRPAAVLVHGGSFQFGDRTSDGEPTFAELLVRRGFVVVSIDYRLTGGYYGLESRQPATDASEDARAAIRFVRKMAAEWKVDEDRILVGGDSAGAVTALNIGYAHGAQHEGSSGNPGYRSDVALTVSVSGQLADQAFCKTVIPVPSGCQTDGDWDDTNDVGSFPGQPPVALIHGTADKIVPYVNGKAVYDRAQKVGLKSLLISIPNAGHVPFQQFETQKTYFKDFMTFVVDAMDLSDAECPKSVIV